MLKNYRQSFSWFLLIGRVILLSVITVCPAIVKAQDSDSKVYKVKHKVFYKQNRLDIHGKAINQRDSVYLQTESGDIDSLIIKIASSKRGLLSNIRFGQKGETDKLFVNPYPVYDQEKKDYVDRDLVYYYQLHNRQSIKIKFNQFSIKAISVPLKVRIGSDDLDFSTDANLGVLGGYSWGKTKFTHRKKIGNTKVEMKNTFGILLGTEKLEFSFEDENQQRVDEESALISTGLGFVYSYQKFAFGLTAGFDFALGENRTKWDYHARPWLGLAIGYSIFSF